MRVSVALPVLTGNCHRDAETRNCKAVFYLKGKNMENDGEWTAGTLGFFVSLLIDAGSNDVAAMFRVVDDEEPDSNGQFVRTMVVKIIPDGHIKSTIEKEQCDRVHKTLNALIDVGHVT